MPPISLPEVIVNPAAAVVYNKQWISFDPLMQKGSELRPILTSSLEPQSAEVPSTDVAIAAADMRGWLT